MDGCLNIMEIKYGNREGQHFTQWRFDILRELLERIVSGPCPPRSEVVAIESPEIWYDSAQDYHCLRFTGNGHLVEVRLYKVFSSKIDGVDHWQGCPTSNIWEYATSIRRETGIVPRFHTP